MVLQGVLGLMAGVSVAAIAAIGLLFYFNQRTEPHTYTHDNFRRGGYEAADENSCCSICLEKVHFSNRAVLQCRHVFHHSCIRQWARSDRTCPNCRKAIE